MSTSDPGFTLPKYDMKDVAVYKPEIIPSVSGYLEYDTNPQNGALGGWEATGGVALDWKNTSVGVDLGYSQKVNAIRIYGSSTTAIPRQEDYQLYYSEDNIEYYPVPGFLFNSYIEDGRCVHLFEFSGIKARYIKVNSLYSGMSNYTFAVKEQQKDIRAERWADKEYRLPGTPALLEYDEDPTTGTLTHIYQSRVTLALVDGASVGLDLGIITDVDAVEIWEAGSALSAGPQDFEVYYAGGDGIYRRIDKLIVGSRAENGRTVYRFSFDSVRAKWIKVHAVSTKSFTVQDIQSDIRAYSATEATSYFNNSFSPKRGGEGDFGVKNDGTLVMTFNAFEGLDDFAEAALGARESLDGGYTWSDEYIMLPNEGFYNIMNCSLLRMENGDLGLFYMVKEEGDIANLYLRRSDDDGATWGPRLLITTAPQGYTIQSSGNRLLRLSTGRILLPVSWSERVNDVYGGVHTYAMIWYSDDDGYTWHRAPGRVNLPNGTLEPTLAEMPSGEIFMSLRTRDSNSMYKAISVDGGLRWSMPEKYNLNSASSTTTVSSIPATGDLLLSWNNAVGKGNNPRNPLSIAISSDGGQSWQVDRNIYEGRVQSSNDFAFPVVAFYGRAVYFQFAAASGYTTALRIMDIDMLYHMVRSSASVTDLPKAPTPSAVYDPETMTLTGLSMNMVYSLDDGQSWKFAGGDTLYFNTDDIGKSILVRDNGGYSHAPSDIQTISTYIPVDSIKLSKDKTIIVEGNTDLLTAEVFPEDATNQSLIWESDDKDVATVDSTGLVTAVGIGSANITATTLDGQYNATCKVIVVEDMITVTDIIPGNNQVNVEFPIISANGKGYSVYLSNTGEDDSYELYSNVNYNKKGVHIRGLTNDRTYYVYIEYKENGNVLFISNPLVVKPSKN
jgi:sialidase-1